MPQKKPIQKMQPKKKKKKLTQQQEFEIMKLVLDKFLWIGTVLIGVAMYFMIAGDVQTNLPILLAGVIVLIIFVVLLVKEYEISK